MSFYVGSPTIPAGMTVSEYRRRRARAPHHWERRRPFIRPRGLRKSMPPAEPMLSDRRTN
jgi:hypothetical protein